MSLISEIEQIVSNRIPGATFVLSSKFKANVNSYFDSPYGINTPLVILDNETEEENDILQNASFNARIKIKLTFLAKDSVNDATDREVSDNIIEPLKAQARGVYGAIWLLDSIRLTESETARFTIKPLFRTFNSVLSGVTCEAKWKENLVTNICPE